MYRSWRSTISSTQICIPQLPRFLICGARERYVWQYCPPRSSHLSSLDCYLWRHIKGVVHSIGHQDLHTLSPYFLCGGIWNIWFTILATQISAPQLSRFLSLEAHEICVSQYWPPGSPYLISLLFMWGMWNIWFTILSTQISVPQLSRLLSLEAYKRCVSQYWPSGSPYLISLFFMWGDMKYMDHNIGHPDLRTSAR
jgi:hypothetical protein